MTHIQPADYRFDYKTETSLSTQLYPQINEKFFFVETQDQNSHVNPVFECHGAQWEKRNAEPGALDDVKAAVIHALGRRVSCAVRRKSGLQFIVMYFHRTSGRSSADTVFVLDHELGHHLVPSGFGASAEVLDGESAADAFACLRTLQRFGPVAGRKILIRESNYRLLAPLRTHVKNDWVHLTGQVLIQIIKDCDQKPLHALSPEDTIAEAESYATRFVPSRAQAESQWARLNDLVDDDVIGNLGATPAKK